MRKDNSGFSMVELLVVLAIMAILAGVGVQAFGLVQKGNIRQTASTLDSMLKETQKNSKNIYSDKCWQLVIKNDSGKFTIEEVKLNEKVVALDDGSTNTEDSPEIIDDQKLDIDVSLKYAIGGADSVKIPEGKMLVLSFHKGSEGVDKIELYDIGSAYGTADSADDIYNASLLGEDAEKRDVSGENITLTVEGKKSSSYSKVVKVYFVTGKIVS